MASINTVMPRISRHLRDKAKTGHPCTTKAPVIATQFTVFANGIPVNRRGDPLKPHLILVPCKDKDGNPAICCKPHGASVKGGSRSVSAQGLPVARAGDRADFGACTSTSNVFAGG